MAARPFPSTTGVRSPGRIARVPGPRPGPAARVCLPLILPLLLPMLILAAEGQDGDGDVPPPTPVCTVIVDLKAFDSEGIGEALVGLCERGDPADLGTRIAFRVADGVEVAEGWPEIGAVYRLVIRPDPEREGGWLVVERPQRFVFDAEEGGLADGESYRHRLRERMLKERILSHASRSADDGAVPAGDDAEAADEAETEEGDRRADVAGGAPDRTGVIVTRRSRCRVLRRGERCLVAYAGDLHPGSAVAVGREDGQPPTPVTVIRCDGRFAIIRPAGDGELPERCYLDQHDTRLQAVDAPP